MASTDQGSLFFANAYGDATPKLARSSDPIESKEAAKAKLKTIGKDQQFAVECVQKTPGLTAAELEHIHGDPLLPGKIWKRLGECAKRGLLKRGPSKKCSITGKRAATWEPVADVVSLKHN